MRSLIFISVAALALAGCARPAEPAGAGLARELAGHVAGPAQSCVTTYPSENLRVIDASTLAYGYGRTIYVNHLAAPCPALEPLNTVIVHGELAGQYCRGDRVQGREPGAIIAGPQCILQNWIPYKMR
jgi:hypothetical protein